MDSVSQPSLRERKRARTRERIVEAGVKLFSTKGYDQTTVADIAAEADIGTRTFFGYFEGKDALLFGAGSDRIGLTVQTIEAASPDDEPARVLLRALDAASSIQDDDLVSDQALLRLRLAGTVPAVRARAAAALQVAVRDITDALVARFPDVDPAAAAGLAGAFTGASSAAVQAVLLEHPKATPVERARRIRNAVATGLGLAPTRNDGDEQ